ncbi:MAG TPA: VOC family protein, partial [Povalibacter sp.]|nr:VOC family protein [Povalibacter sp.]
RYARVAQVRIARPTIRLQEVITFYCEGLGLRELGRFENHAGYSGVFLGLPDRTVHLEFTQHVADEDAQVPSGDDLLVFYIPDATQLRALCQRLEARGHASVEPENPYWADKSVTFADPDGRRVVLCNVTGI